MNFWRSEAYSAFFDYLDSKGGFYYEVNPFHNTFLTSIFDQVKFANSVGEMHRFIPSAPHFSYLDQVYISGTRLGTNIIRTHIVHGWGIIGRTGNVRVIPVEALVKFSFLRLLPLFFC
jgi:hypothetical protein